MLYVANGQRRWALWHLSRADEFQAARFATTRCGLEIHDGGWEVDARRPREIALCRRCLRLDRNSHMEPVNR